MVCFLAFPILCFGLGELLHFYVRFPIWDSMLHTLFGFLISSVGYAVLRNALLRRGGSEREVFGILCLFTVCFSVAFGVLWEFFEFSMDQLFGLDMQKDTIVHSIQSVLLDATQNGEVVQIDGIWNVLLDGRPLSVDGYLEIGLIDTMKDLSVNLLGAVLYVLLAYFAYHARWVEWLFEKVQITKRKDGELHLPE
jgi:hypothetical protein